MGDPAAGARRPVTRGTAGGRRCLRGLPALVAVLLAAGCTTVLYPTGAANTVAWQSRLARLQTLDEWQLQGRIGVVTTRHGGSANLSWHEQGARMSLSFSGPFGLGAVRLWGDPDEMFIRDSKGNEWATATPETALEKTLGWPVPVASLRYWVTGQPAPDAPYRLQVGERGLVMQIEQQGWTVRYEAYAPAAGLLLPVRLAASRPGGRIKLVVSRWKLAASP